MTITRPAAGPSADGQEAIARAALRQRRGAWAAAAALAAIYLLSYAADTSAPGNSVRFPLGWWGWWDQSQYLRSAVAFAGGGLDPREHWYPLGYSLFLSVFVQDPSGHVALLPDLLGLMAAFAAFVRFAGAVGVGAGWGGALFVAGTCASASVRATWAEPWNTTLSAALLWWLLALSAGRLGVDGRLAARRRGDVLRLVAMGVLAGAICVTRPTDLLLVGIWGGWMLWGWLRERGRAADPAWVAAGLALVLVPAGMLWVRIYGFHASPYMAVSRAIGFRLSGLWWKTYLLLVAAEPWFPDDAGLLERLPWILPGLAAIPVLPWIATGRARGLLVLLAMLVVPYTLLFFSYSDLVPFGLWRFHNVHYLKWTFPGLLLLGLVLARALLAGPRRAPLAALAALTLLSCVRLVPRPMRPGNGIWMVGRPAPVPGWSALRPDLMAVRDRAGLQRNLHDVRILEDGAGWRIIAMAGALHGPVRPVSGDGVAGPAWVRPPEWTMRFHLGAPAWLGNWEPVLPPP